MIISISGAAGSGKTTIAKMLASQLGWPHYYIGKIRRQKAKAKGLTLAEYNKLGETDPATDVEVDEYQKELSQKENNFIIEGRTSWYFIPTSLKIYFDIDEKVGAERIFSDLRKNSQRNEDQSLNTYENVLQSVRERKQSDIKRYKKYYNIDVFDKKNYDYVIDTTNFNIEEVFNKALGIIKGELKKIDKK